MQYIKLGSSTKLPHFFLFLISYVYPSYLDLNTKPRKLGQIPFLPRPVLAFGYCNHLCLGVCLSVDHEFICMIIHHLFKLEPPNWDKRCKMPWLRSLVIKFRFKNLDQMYLSMIKIPIDFEIYWLFKNFKPYFSLNQTLGFLFIICIVVYIFSATITYIIFSETIAGFQVTPPNWFYWNRFMRGDL